MNPVLKVFVIEHCSNCDEARAIAGRIDRTYPEVQVEIIDISQPQVVVPDAVFATPTFMLNGRIVSLGTPYPEEIARRVEEAITARLGG